ncbi:MAG TPA: DUF6599 family protein [Chthoniobacteraceae bacterium]|jgi:hypothetical protein|nr:DUF6599 family protein [Chthoniobacteraceae bacterium]
MSTGAAPPPATGRGAAPPKRKGSRSAFVRTKVSFFERALSIGIVCLLAGIAVALWYAGHHFDPSIYSVTTADLESTRQAVAGKAGTLRVDASQTGDGASSAVLPSASTGPAAAQPDAGSEGSGDGTAAPATGAALKKEPLEIALPGIKPMGDTEFYSSDDLYQKIDGRSPAYQGFNFQELRCRTFSIDGDGSSYVDVYEYRMDTNVDAFGIFALERDPKGKPLPFAKDGYSGEMGYFFRQGDVYVQIIASDQNPKTMQMAQAIAENRAKVLPADDSGLEGRRALPSAGLVAGSITFTQDNAQGQDFLKNVFQGTYDFEGQKLSYFVMATTPDAASTAWKSYLAFCGKYGGKAAQAPDIAGAKVFQASNFGTYKVIYQRAGQLGGVVDATNAKAAADFVSQYLQGQIQ